MMSPRGQALGWTVAGVALALDRAATGFLHLSLRTVPRWAGTDGDPTTSTSGPQALAALATLLDLAGRADGSAPAGDCDGCLWSIRLGWGAMVNLDLDPARLGARARRRIAA